MSEEQKIPQDTNPDYKLLSEIAEVLRTLVTRLDHAISKPEKILKP
jgi:hypothetical protein